MGEIFSQLISNTENVDYFLGLDITLNNQVEIWAWMSLSSVAVVYIAHLSAALRMYCKHLSNRQTQSYTYSFIYFSIIVISPLLFPPPPYHEITYD